MKPHPQACLHAPHRQAPTPDGQIAAFINRAPYRLFRPLDSGHGLWPCALAQDRVPKEGKSSRGRPERSAAKSKGDEVGAPGPARGDPLAGPRACPPLEGPIKGFMWTSCHEPRNRDAAWRVISALFRRKPPASSKTQPFFPFS